MSGTISSSSIIFQPLSLPLTDAVHNLSLHFRPSLYLSAPLDTSINSFEALQSHVVLRASSLTLHISITLNKDPLQITSLLLCAWARSISSANLWSQLDFATSLSIFSSTDIRILLTRASAIESMLPDILNDVVTLDELHMQFEFFTDADGRNLQVHELIPLTDTAIRSFMSHSFFTQMAPLVGVPGLVKACDERILPVEVLAEVISRRVDGAGEKKEVEGKVWETVVRNIKGPRKLDPIVMDTEVGQGDDGLLVDGSEEQKEE